MGGGTDEGRKFISGVFIMQGMFDGIVELIMTLFVLCIIFVPLGIWKLVDIAIWLWHHFSIHIS
jgi:hypothetical protein